MEYIIDAHTYLPEFLKDNDVMLDIMDCLNALISSDQPYFDEIQGAYYDMLYRSSQYDKLTDDAKINIIKGLGFSYLLNLIELDSAQLSKLLFFFELIYVLKGKTEGLHLVLDILFGVTQKDTITYNTAENILNLRKDYLQSILKEYNDSIINDLILTFDYNTHTVYGTTTTGSGKTLSINQSNVYEAFYYLTMTFDGSEYILSLETSMDPSELTLMSFDVKYIDYYDLENKVRLKKYKVNDITLLAPDDIINNKQSIYRYIAWDEESPKAENFTAKLTLQSSDYSTEFFEKLKTFIRSYMLPWVDITTERVIEADTLYIYVAGILNFGARNRLSSPPWNYNDNANPMPSRWTSYHNWLTTLPRDTASITDLPVYDGSTSLYDMENCKYVATTYDGPGQGTPITFDSVNFGIKILRPVTGTLIGDVTYEDLTDQATIMISTDYPDKDKQITYTEQNNILVERYFPISYQIIYNEKIREGTISCSMDKILYFNENLLTFSPILE